MRLCFGLIESDSKVTLIADELNNNAYLFCQDEWHLSANANLKVIHGITGGIANFLSKNYYITSDNCYVEDLTVSALKIRNKQCLLLTKS